MAFRLFSFGRKEKAPVADSPAHAQVKRKLAAAEIPAFLRSEFSSRMDEERKKFTSFSRDILSHMSSFRGEVEDVRDKKFGSGESYYAAVNMIKDTWAKKAISGIASYQSEFRSIPEGADFSYYNRLYSGTLRLMNEAAVLPKQQIVLKRFFEDESRRMGETLRLLSQSMEGLGGLVRGGGALRAESGAVALLKEFEAAEAEASGLKSRISALSADAEKKAKDVLSAEKDADAVAKSPAWKEIDMMEKERETSIRERDGMEADMSARMGSLKRPLKIFAHEAPELDKGERAMAEEISHSPVKAMLSSDPAAIERLLAKALAGGRKMNLPEKDAAKLSEIEGMISTGWVKKTVAKYNSLSRHIEETWERMKAIDIAAKKVHAERLIGNLKMELEALDRQEKQLEGKLKAAESNAAGKKKEISGLLSKELSLEVEVV